MFPFDDDDEDPEIAEALRLLAERADVSLDEDLQEAGIHVLRKHVAVNDQQVALVVSGMLSQLAFREPDMDRVFEEFAEITEGVIDDEFQARRADLLRRLGDG